MLNWFLQAAGFLALALGSTAISWRQCVAFVGVSLALCSFVSSVACYGTSFEARITIEIISAAVVVSSARLAFKAAGCKLSILVVVLSILDIAFMFLIAAGYAPRHVFGAVTNAIFVAQCLIVASPGVRDAFVDMLSSRTNRRMVGGNSVTRNAGRPWS